MTNDVRRNLILCVASSVLFVGCGTTLPFPGLTPEEVFALGLESMGQEDWGGAARSFEFVLASPGFSRPQEARLLLAEAHFADGRYIESRSQFERVVQRWPADTVAVRAALGVCRSLAALSPIPERDQSYTRQARFQCRSVAADFAGLLVGLEASLLADSMTVKLAKQDYDTGIHYLKRNLHDSALLYFEAVATEFPQTEWAPWALYQMIETFGKLGYQRDAETTRNLLLDAYPESEPAGLLEDGDA